VGDGGSGRSNEAPSSVGSDVTGDTVGLFEGDVVGRFVGESLGLAEGKDVGLPVGIAEVVGEALGHTSKVGGEERVGFWVGLSVG